MNEILLQPIPDNAVLCYVDHGIAYFTTQTLDRQWGDDWDDAPYEHNAEPPYQPYAGQEPWAIYPIAFRSYLETPGDRADGNSGFSVQDINGGATAWLSSPSWDADRIEIYAGASIREFVEKIRASHGDVFFPIAARMYTKNAVEGTIHDHPRLCTD